MWLHIASVYITSHNYGSFLLFYILMELYRTVDTYRRSYDISCLTHVVIAIKPRTLIFSSSISVCMCIVVISFEFHLVCETKIACYCFVSVRRDFFFYFWSYLIDWNTNNHIEHTRRSR